MKINDYIHVIAGLFVLTGTLLALTVSLWWTILPLFVGANLFQYGLTGFCPLGILLKKAGVEEQ